MKDPPKTASTALDALAQGLSAVAARLEPKEAAAVLTEAMKDPKNATALTPLAQGLSAVAARMEPKDAAAELAQAMKDPQEHATALYSLAHGALSGGGRSYGAQGGCPDRRRGRRCTHPSHEGSQERKGAQRMNWRGGLSAVASRMEPQEGGGEAAALLTLAMKETKDANAVFSLAQGLWAVAARMEPKEASQAAAQAAALLTQAMKETTNANALSPLAQGGLVGGGRALWSPRRPPEPSPYSPRP